MTPFKRPVSAAGAAVLMALSLAACGSSYPEDASQEDFCNAVGDIVASGGAVQGEEPTEDEWEDLQQSYEDLGETGTPEDIGEDERKGFEVIVDAITDLDYDEAKDEFGDAGGEDIPGVSEEDSDNAEKFFTYATEECSSELGGGTGETPEAPTDTPTEVESSDGGSAEAPTEEAPTELETDTEVPTESASE